MRDFLKVAGWTIGAVVLGAGVVTAANVVGLTNYSLFGKAYQNTRTEIFHNTDAYQSGNRQQFENMLADYRRQTTSEAKAIVLDHIRRFAMTIPQDQVPAEVQGLLVAADKQ